MRCAKAKILISAQLDEQLSERDELALERHLASCESCALEKVSLAALSRTMQTWPDEEPSAWLAQSFALKLKDLQIEPQTAFKPQRPRRLVFGAAATGFAAVLAAVALLLHGQMAQPPMPQPGKVAQVPSIVGKVQPAPVKPAKQPVVVAKAETEPQPEQVVKEEPKSQPTVTVVKKHVNRPRMIAYSIEPKRRYISFKTRNHPSLVAMGPSFKNLGTGELTDRGRLDHEQARQLMEKALGIANNTKGDAAETVTSNLSEASVTMDETLERVRGTLRQAADALDLQTPAQPESVQPESAPDNNGGTDQ